MESRMSYRGRGCNSTERKSKRKSKSKSKSRSSAAYMTVMAFWGVVVTLPYLSMLCSHRCM